jgi:hypothetical protein
MTLVFLSWLELDPCLAAGVDVAFTLEAEPYIVFRPASDEAHEAWTDSPYFNAGHSGDGYLVFNVPEARRQEQAAFVASHKARVLQDYLSFYLQSACDYDPQAVGADATRFAGLHSWYKHLGALEKAFPLLLPGAEPRNQLDRQMPDDGRSAHWRFVFEDSLPSYSVCIGPVKYAGVPEALRQEISRFPIYLDNTFQPGNKFQLLICERACADLHARLTSHSSA